VVARFAPRPVNLATSVDASIRSRLAEAIDSMPHFRWA